MPNPPPLFDGADPMTFWEQLTEELLQIEAPLKSYERGAAYFKSGHVYNLSFSDGVITAFVSGTMDSYRVVMTWKTPEQPGECHAPPELDGECSCPHWKEGHHFCKHLVATGLAVQVWYRTYQEKQILLASMKDHLILPTASKRRI